MLSSVVPSVSTGLVVSGIHTDNPTFQWDGMANATGYRIELTPAPVGSSWNCGTWHLAYDLGVDCGDAAGVCTWVDPALAGKLPVGEYEFRVRAWGPGGMGAFSEWSSFTYTGP